MFDEWYDWIFIIMLIGLIVFGIFVANTIRGESVTQWYETPVGNFNRYEYACRAGLLFAVNHEGIAQIMGEDSLPIPCKAVKYSPVELELIEEERIKNVR